MFAGGKHGSLLRRKKVFVRPVEMGKSKSLGVLKHGGLELPTRAGTIKLLTAVIC